MGTARIVDAIPIRGLLMLGSENPLWLDGMDWRPPVPQLRLVHAIGDKVISINDIRSLAEHWNLQMDELTSTVAGGARDAFGDDINHEFIAKDLIQQAVSIFSDFLDTCAAGAAVPVQWD